MEGAANCGGFVLGLVRDARIVMVRDIFASSKVSKRLQGGGWAAGPICEVVT